MNQEDKINGMTIREWILTFLSKCTLSLVDERQELNEAVRFCEQTIKQFGEAASMNVQMLEFGQGICRSFFSKKDDQYFHESQILVCVPEKMAIQCKVSQILAVVYACSSKDVTLSELQRVSAIRSASYFHQCSIGSHFNSCFLSQDQNQMEVDGSHDLRLVLAPRSMKELEESMSEFFKSLPNLSVTVLCISMLSDKSYRILHKFLPESPNSVWLMISRFHLKIGPVVVIFPVYETLTSFPYKKDTSVCEWTCPWAGIMFDQVAPVLRLVLEKDVKLNTSGQKSSEVIQKKMKLDNILRGFLRDLEISWLGPWNYLLLGECSGCNDLDDNVDKITNDYRSLNSVFEGDQHCLEQLKSNYGCYIGTSGGKIYKSVKKKTCRCK